MHYCTHRHAQMRALVHMNTQQDTCYEYTARYLLCSLKCSRDLRACAHTHTDSSPAPYADEEDDDFKVDVDDEGDEEKEAGADGITCSPSPMLDDSIMSHNATLALDSRTSPSPPPLPSDLPSLFPRCFPPRVSLSPALTRCDTHTQGHHRTRGGSSQCLDYRRR